MAEKQQRAPRITRCIKKRYYSELDFTWGNEPTQDDYILKRNRLTSPNKDFPFEAITYNGKKYYLGEIYDTYYDKQGREIYQFYESREQNKMTSMVYIDRPGLPTYKVEISTDGQVGFYELVDGIQGDFPNISFKDGRLDQWDEFAGGSVEEEFHKLEHGTPIEKDEHGNIVFEEFGYGLQSYMKYEYTYAEEKEEL